MDYIINKQNLKNLIEEEVSLAADQAYSDDGVSLYDQVVLTEKDKGTIDRFIDDAVSTLCRRTHDICSFVPYNPQQAVDSLDNPLYYVVDDGVVTNEVTTTETDFPVYANNEPTGTAKLYFHVPDIDVNNTDAAKREITRFISLYSVLELFKSRRANLVEQYMARVQNTLDNVVSILKTRKKP